ncbi:MAG: lamin tail domain-containing protein [Actinophytocola sp.]|nr:lamin tail domain-containing protein [Actinophytocola sp.]
MRGLTRIVVLTIATVLAGGLATAPAQAAGAVVIYKVRYDSPGSDTGNNVSLNAEFVVLKNTSGKTRYLKGWKLRDVAGHVYTFPATKIKPGRTMRVHTGTGSNDGNDRYWGSDWYVWNNTGDTAKLRRKNGTLADKCSWGDGDGVKNC